MASDGIPPDQPATPPKRDMDWRDIVLLLIGIWLFVVPWVLVPTVFTITGSLNIRLAGGLGAARWTDWICGVLIASLSLGALVQYMRWRWFVLILGAVVFTAPWFTGLMGPTDFVSPRSPMLGGFAMVFLVMPGAGGFVWNSWLCGAAVILLTLWAAWAARKQVVTETTEFTN